MNVSLIDFHWFYGAVSQSLAALIGVIGMFIVYRLQIQENRIKDAFENLCVALSAMDEKDTQYMTVARLLKVGYGHIKSLNAEILGDNERIKDLLIELDGIKKNKEDYNEGN